MLLFLLLISTLSTCSRRGNRDGQVDCPPDTVRFGNSCLEDGGAAPSTENGSNAGESEREDGNEVGITAEDEEGQENDGDSENTAEDLEPAPPQTTPLAITISSPTNEYTTEADSNITFEGELTGLDTNTEYDQITLIWSSNLDGVLHTDVLTSDDTTVFITNALSMGIHTISLEARVNEEPLVTQRMQVGICGWELLEDFNQDLSPEQWRIYHDAYRDSRGWIEMTGNSTGKKGHIFNIGQILNPGNIRLRFNISTGQCDEIGPCSDTSCAADGFAASVYNLESVASLDDLIATTQTGGGLGYHVAGGSPTESFHIEFDTWYNGVNDPTAEDHVAIHLNSNAYNAIFYQAVPNLEDNSWHDILLEIQGISIKVYLNDVLIIGGEIPGFDFKGGYIGFSGTTGACTNYHRIDNLRIQPQCQF